MKRAEIDLGGGESLQVEIADNGATLVARVLNGDLDADMAGVMDGMESMLMLLATAGLIDIEDPRVHECVRGVMEAFGNNAEHGDGPPYDAATRTGMYDHD